MCRPCREKCRDTEDTYINLCRCPKLYEEAESGEHEQYPHGPSEVRILAVRVTFPYDLLRCIQHPYLVSHDIEPKGLNPHEAHSRLVAGSSKLRLLQGLLPKLKARGHRVLLFSQARIIPHRFFPSLLT